MEESRALEQDNGIGWRHLPELSADEALYACRQMNAARRLHVSLLRTLGWERDSGLAIRRDMLCEPSWRWNYADYFVSGDSRVWLPAPQHIKAAADLYTLSNRRIIQDFLAYMDALAEDWRRLRPSWRRAPRNQG